MKTTRTNFVKRQAISQLLLLVFSVMTFDKKNPYHSGTETYDLVSHSAKQSRPFNIFTLKIQEVIPIDCPLRLSKRCLHLARFVWLILITLLRLKRPITRRIFHPTDYYYYQYYYQLVLINKFSFHFFFFFSLFILYSFWL